MSAVAEEVRSDEMPAESSAKETPPSAPAAKRRGKWWRRLGILFVAALILMVAARAALPHFVRYYVNRTIDQSPLYEGKIGAIDIHLYRGAYTIHDVRLLKRTGNVPVPLFAARKVDLAIQWDALWNGKIVGRVVFETPELNFVDSGDTQDPSQGQTGEGGPWLQIIRDLFPFKINSAVVHNGSVHFRTFAKDPPVDVYLSKMEASVENLKNVRDETTPNAATVKVKALAMDQANLEMQMRFNPFSYKPSFQLALRLLNLDTTKLNQLARAYGMFDFERGYFDLVVELRARQGQVDGIIKPLFRDIQVLSLDPDIKEDNVVEFFWEALVGAATGILTNPPRNQFGTSIPVSGSLENPRPDILVTVGNVLRNAFIRAYLPRLQQSSRLGHISGLEFGRGSITEPSAVGDDK